MSALNAGVASAGDDIEDAGFAKLVGEEFEFFMQAYEMILGRDTKKGKVDLDLSVIGGGKDISRHHARIFYDFENHEFFLEVLGKNGCTVQDTVYVPGDDPVKLKSQDLIQIGELKFYFLLPRCSIFQTFAARRAHIPSQSPSSSVMRPAHIPSQSPSSSVMPPAHIPSQSPSSSVMCPAHIPSLSLSSSVMRPAHIPSLSPSSSVMRPAHIQTQFLSSSVMRPAYPYSSNSRGHSYGIGFATAATRHTHIPSQPMSSSFMRHVHPHFSDFRGHFYGNGHGRGNSDNGTRVGTATQGMLMNQSQLSFGELSLYSERIDVEPIGTLGERVNNVSIRTDKDTGNQQLQLKEEKDIITCVATLLSNNCGPREWMPVEKLHSELIDHFGKIWPCSKVQKYLTPEDGPSTGTIRKPWYSLLELLKKHPEHFVISTVCRGTATSEFVSLDSLLA